THLQNHSPSLTVTQVLYFLPTTATPAIYTLSLHDALPIYVEAFHHPRNLRQLQGVGQGAEVGLRLNRCREGAAGEAARRTRSARSEEHTSELQSRGHLVCRLLLEKKKQQALS